MTLDLDVLLAILGVVCIAGAWLIISVMRRIKRGELYDQDQDRMIDTLKLLKAESGRSPPWGLLAAHRRVEPQGPGRVGLTRCLNTARKSRVCGGASALLGVRAKEKGAICITPCEMCYGSSVG